tara:strand:+ start:898 stop:1065 length:168 start_codon:yes stop_codon:yes gene_type:complete
MKERMAIDAAVAAPALSLPLWLHTVQETMQFGIVCVTLIIVVIRARIAWREWRNK